MEYEALLQFAKGPGAEYGLILVNAIVIFVIGRWIARLLARGVNRVMERSSVDPLLAMFLHNIVHVLLLILVILITFTALGIQTSSLAAITVAAGMAVALVSTAGRN